MQQSRPSNRYHHEFLQQDLLGDWVLIRSWGSIEDINNRYALKKVTTFQRAKTDIVRDKKYRRLLPHNLHK